MCTHYPSLRQAALKGEWHEIDISQWRASAGAAQPGCQPDRLGYRQWRGAGNTGHTAIALRNPPERQWREPAATARQWRGHGERQACAGDDRITLGRHYLASRHRDACCCDGCAARSGVGRPAPGNADGGWRGRWRHPDAYSDTEIHPARRVRASVRKTLPGDRAHRDRPRARMHHPGDRRRDFPPPCATQAHRRRACGGRPGFGQWHVRQRPEDADRLHETRR